jgi:prepilin-type N-terminal cleavage/methylation domain-containing protein
MLNLGRGGVGMNVAARNGTRASMHLPGQPACTNGGNMNTLDNPRPQSPAPHPCSHGFTLIEMLVVVAIIGILAGLITAAAIVAKRHAVDASIALELKQLEMACQAYKEKFGEYPPDFCFTNTNDYPLGNPVGDAARAAVLRHLAKAFPRYQPGAAGGGNTGWQGFVDDVNAGWSINVNTLTPFQALRFWLGGRLVDGVFTGFSANQLNPFDASPSRIKPFFEFDQNRIVNGRYWPKDAFGNLSTGAIVYFRAENNSYVVGGVVKSVVDPGDTSNPQVFPAVDRPQCNPNAAPTPIYVFVNPKTFQIFSSGRDCQYTTPADNAAAAAFYPNNSNPPMTQRPIGPYIYPDGYNYDPDGRTFDDITNFSGGTLESKMP